MAEVFNVEGKRALITGASEEVGFNIALTLAKHGCRLVLAGDASELVDISKQITILANLPNQERRRDIEVVELGVSAGEKFVDEAVEKAWLAFGGLDAFLNCAAYTGPLNSFLETSEEQWEKIVNTNFRHACIVCKAIGKRMQDTQTEGSIIFVTSIIGTERGIFPGVAIPGASMAAVNYLTRAIAMELGKYKIRVNAIARGLYDSDALLKLMSEDARRKEGRRVVPLQRWLDVKRDFASTILYLVGDSSSFMTGTVIFVDGGQSLMRPRLRSYL